MSETAEADRWRRVKDIYYEALELTGDARRDFLARLPDDPEIVREVVRMIEIEPHVDGFIETPAVSGLHDMAAESSAPGRVFGHYRVIRKLGHGGMGAVFLADRTDGQFTQQVALKIIRQSVMDDVLERRFMRERQILANLNHPFIARLIDGGISENGELYLAMEYVAGENLLNYVAARSLSANQRLRLFLKICDAVGAAHRSLVVHLDLKPSNILVTAEGSPKLLDFGLSRFLEEQFSDIDATATALRAFTPAYAAPEQIAGRPVSIAADVFSLGVILYELLTGQKPFPLNGMTADAILRTYNNIEPQPPSSAVRDKTHEIRTDARAQPTRISRDLDNIVLKAIKFDPSERYREVGELAADLERYLNGRPVLARPAGVFYRFGKFVRRHRIGMAAAVVIVVSVAAGTGMTLRQMSETERARDRAERRFNDVRKLSNSLLFEITPRIERLEGSTEAREILVSRALEYLDSLATEAEEDIGLQRELAAAYLQIGEIQGNPSRPNLNDFAGATTSISKAIAILQKLPPSADHRRQLAATFRQLAKTRPGDTTASIADAEKAVAIFDELIAAEPTADLRLQRLETLTELAQLHTSNTDFKAALAVLERVFPGLSELDPTNDRTREISVFARTQKAFALSWENRQNEAEPLMTAAVSDAEALAASSPNDARLQQVLWEAYYRAGAIYETIRDELSLSYARKCVSLKEYAVRRDPLDVQSKHNLARSFSRVALAHSNLRQIDEAVKNWRLAEQQLDELTKTHPKNDAYRADLATLYYRLGQAEKNRGNFEPARQAMTKAREIYAALNERDPANTNLRRHVGLSSKHLGDLLASLGKRTESAVEYRAALGVFESLEAAGKLPEYDRKALGEIRSALNAK